MSVFRVERKGPNRLDIEFSGKLDSDAMRAGINDLLENSTGIENGRMLYRVGDFDLPTLGAIGVELSHIPELFRWVRKFDRAALLADQAWLRKAGEIEGALFPGLEIKAFESGEEAEAETWLES